MRKSVTGSVKIIAALACVSLIALPASSWAGRSGGGGGGGHGSGGRGGAGHGGASHSGQGHHHHRGYGYGAAFIGGALFYPWPYSYGFYPVWDDLEPPGPVVYIEQFIGTPTPETTDWIYCPTLAASYPEVTDCPNGWQRVIPQPQATGEEPAPWPGTAAP